MANGAIAGLAQLATSPDSSWLAATEGRTAATAGRTPFVVRRVANARYRPPSMGVPYIGPGVTRRLRALDHTRAQLFHQTYGSARATTHWELSASEQYRADNAVELLAAGSRGAGPPALERLLLSGRRGPFAAGVGDVEPVIVSGVARLHRLRGLALRFTGDAMGHWLALGGVPTPLPNSPTPPLRLGGMAIEDLRFDEARLSAAVLGFSRGQLARAGGLGLAADTLAGRGAAGSLGWRAPFAQGRLAGRLGAQLHSLEGPRSLAAQHALEWTFTNKSLLVAVSDERSTRRARLLGTDRFATAPRSEQRWNIQSRFAKGRAESHLTGAIREGGDPTLATRTLQVGGSGNLGGSGWYAGGDALWDRRALGAAERRFSLFGGGLLSQGHAVITRIEYSDLAAGERAISLIGDGSFALRAGARLALEPRLGWDDAGLEQGSVAARLSWPLAWLSSRVTGSLALGAIREERFQGSLTEISLALSLAPRLRDRADLEVRRMDQGGRPSLEYSASYDAQMERYDTPGRGWLSSRDTGRVTVRVVRSGNLSGASEILVSLDGRELRFTDADGMAHFDRVAPGVHVVAIEERSLPENHLVLETSRVFVTVERGQAPEPVQFMIGRAQRRVQF